MRTHKRQYRSQRARPALTLIEVLVVLGILGSLFGLMFAALQSVRAGGIRRATTVDIMKLDAQLKIFYTRFGSYPPGTMTLPPATSQQRTLLKAMFPSMTDAQIKDPATWGANAGTLSGDECLVFFLAQTKLYEFDPHRLTTGSNGHPAFQDPFGHTYAYFSSQDGYANGCPALMPGGAYLSPTGGFLKPSSFQIMSAGSDGVFGPGGSVLAPGGGASLPLAARDDITNFSDRGVLGGY
jgi:type II secretory pathway pseudopilin PulG